MHLRAASSAMPLGIAFTRCSIPAHALNACSSCLEDFRIRSINYLIKEKRRKYVIIRICQQLYFSDTLFS